MDSQRVVITGLGIASPLGLQLDEVWTALVEGKSGVVPNEAFDASGFRSQMGGHIPKFVMGDYIPKTYRKSTKVMARDIQIALVAAYQAVHDAGLKTRCLIERKEMEAPSNVDPRRFGANIGAGLICADLQELADALHSAADEQGQFSLNKWGREGMNNLTPLWLLKFLPNMLACHVTIVHDAQAPSNTITCGEASSHLAIGEAYRTIRRGAADVCICGGAESKMNCMSTFRQDLFGRLVRGEPTEQACRPFDRDHAGTVASEGGGLVILESLEHARERQARIYGEVVGFGASCNTNSWTKPDPSGQAISMAMNMALKDAQVAPNSVGLIGTFGSGIPEYDDSEAAAIGTVFGEHAKRTPALAIKGALGNNGAGSGAIDLAIAIKAMQYNAVPASKHTRSLCDHYNLNVVTGDVVDAKIDCLISTAYSLSGGQTASIVVKSMEAE